MTDDDDREKRIAYQEAIIRQQEAARQKQDRPSPELKPESERGKIERHVPKTEAQIHQEAVENVNRQDAEKEKEKAEIVRESPVDGARAKEPAENFSRQASDDRQHKTEDRSSAQEREEKLSSKFLGRDKRKEREKERDRRFGSRYLRDEERER